MFRLFKKKLEQKITKIDVKVEKFNVGKSTIKVKFKEGTDHIEIVYGYVYQSKNLDPKNGLCLGFFINKPNIISSENEADNYLYSVQKQDIFYNKKTKTMQYNLKIKSAQIVKTEDHFIDFEVTYIIKE